MKENREIDESYVVPRGVVYELAIQCIMQLDDRPAVRILTRTRRGARVLGHWKATGPNFTMSQLDDLMSVVHREFVETMIVTTGVQLALPSE